MTRAGLNRVWLWASMLWVALFLVLADKAAAATLRAGEHPTFSRLLVDLNRPVHYAVAREGDRVALTFTDPADPAAVFDLDSNLRTSLSRLGELAQEKATGRLVLSFTIRGD